jgi:uncharacterized lipoprotein YehR (DUF1307 family)
VISLKKIIAALTIILLLIGCSKPNDQQQSSLNYGMLDVENVYDSVEEITDHSTLIVEVMLGNTSNEIEYGNTNFSKTNVTIKEVYKGDPEINNSNIDIIELSSINITKDKENGKFLLFLRPYEGPITTNAYVISGVYQGKFKISNNDELIYDADKYSGINRFQKEFVKTPKEALPQMLNG